VAAGYTYTQYRQRAGEAAGFHLFTSTTGTGTASQLIVSSLTSTELEASFLKDCWCYVPSTLEARRIQKRGLDTGTGTISVDHAFASPIGNAVSIEFYGKLPPTRMEGRLGLNQIVNKVLSECWTIQKVSIAGVTDQREYQIGATYPWLVEEDQIVEVYYRGANADPNDDDMVMPRWRWVPGGDNPRIEIGMPISTGDTLKPMFFIPMSWWLNQGGTWGVPATEGLSAETDMALLDLEGFEIIAQWYIYKEQAKWGDAADQDRFEKLAAAARFAANTWKTDHLQRADDIGRDDHWNSLIRVPASGEDRYGFEVLSRG
jgi:hypothetical protein